MRAAISLINTMNSMVPISRFNRGEASKIFEEVKESGCKVVVKNNTPACVLLTPEMYQEMVDMIEDQYLLAVAEERLKYDTGVTYTQEELMARDGITFKDLEDIPMEYGVDFE